MLIRALPYPYQGAISVSSDPDFLQFTFMEELYKFLNTNSPTKFGIGLNLEVTGGMFFYTKNDYNFSYYCYDNPYKKSKYSDRLDDYLRAGWIDTNHAFGDFDFKGRFNRDLALQAYESMDKNSVYLPVFTNHGDSNNIQNVGSYYENYLGDSSDSDVFHSDLFSSNGTEFIWAQNLVYTSAKKSTTLTENPLKHKTSVMGFDRLRGTKYHAPNLESLSYQLSLVDFKRMYQENLVFILYQHLGTLSRHAKYCSPSTIESLIKYKYLLAPFYKLAEESQKGKLWVSGTGRLLKYLKMRKYIKIEEKTYNTFIIHAPFDVDFSGLTIYANTSDIVHVYHNNISLPIKYNGPDETGKYSVSIEMSQLEDIWSHA